MEKRRWMTSEFRFILQNYESMTYNEIASILNRNANSVRNVAARLKIRKYHDFTEEEERFIMENFGTMSVADINAALGFAHTEGSIKSLVYRKKKKYS